MEQKTLKVEAKIVDSRYDLSTNSVLVSLDLNGKKRSASISAESFVKFDATIEKSRSIMMEYAKKLGQRTLPIYVELTEEQLNGDGPIDV